MKEGDALFIPSFPSHLGPFFLSLFRHFLPSKKKKKRGGLRMENGEEEEEEMWYNEKTEQ